MIYDFVLCPYGKELFFDNTGRMETDIPSFSDSSSPVVPSPESQELNVFEQIRPELIAWMTEGTPPHLAPRADHG